jgi:hypothetical protein
MNVDSTPPGLEDSPWGLCEISKPAGESSSLRGFALNRK